MKILPVSSYEKGRVPVFLLNDGQNIEKHQFFKFLGKEDQKFLSAFQRKSPIKSGHNHLVFLPSGGQAFLIGVEEKIKFSHRKAILASRRVVWAARRERVSDLSVSLDDFVGSGGPKDKKTLAEIISIQFETADFEFVDYKTPPPEGWFIVNGVHVHAKMAPKTLEERLRRGQIIGKEVNRARVLSNTPGSDMTPARLAEAASEAGKAAGFKVTVIDEEGIKKLRMGGVLGVSKGSAERPRFIVMEYLRGPKKEAPVVLIGKGVTFDTGGLNLKPEQGIYEMHMDMSGGAAVIHALAALARLGVKKNIVGLVPAVENMPSGSSYHPGDLLKTMSGKTIEVLNTDAEGRIILADALEYAKRYKPRLVVDIATLTSGAMSALGQRASAIFTSKPSSEKAMRFFGELTGDYVWPLPLWEEYEEDIKGTFGDLANIGKNRYGGAINAAVFLWQFIKGFSWIHIDMAPRMTAIEGEFLAKGAAGATIALLTYFIKESKTI